METRNAVQKTVAIVGGGVSGALMAYQLQQQGVQARVIIIDPRQEFGLGLAYSMPSLRHLLNVPAGKISALPDQPDHFLHWLRTHYDPEATESSFAPRTVFGSYIQSLLASIKGVEQEHSSVVDYRPLDRAAVLTLSNGCQLRADIVVLATGNFDPAPLPNLSGEAEETGAYRHNAWTADAYDGIDPEAPVTIIGTGLTGVDVLLRLRETGHRGIVTAVSRHGIFPNRHADYAPLSFSAIPPGTPATCLAYLRALRAAINRGAEWRAAVDSLRATTNELWLALPLEEQKRFRRHLQRRWDVVRHRMAPSIADSVEAERQAGTLVVREGHLLRVEARVGGATVTIRTREGIVSFATARVINCTGPDMNYRRVKSPLLESLFAQGLISAGPMGGGFRCSRDGAVVDAKGEESKVLFSLGPGRLGTLLESIAVPEIRQQALELATILKRRMGTIERHSLRADSPALALPSGIAPQAVTAI